MSPRWSRAARFGLLFVIGTQGACGPTSTGDADATGDSDETDLVVDPRADDDSDGAPAAQDCDDNDPNRYPGNVEVCDGIDNDCDDRIDDADSSLDPSSRTPWYADRDGDGFGDAALEPACTEPARASPVGGDCDDRDPKVFPDAPELCNDKDDDCDTLVDDDDEVAPASLRTWYVDLDGDGFGVDATAYASCDPGPNGVGVPGDCDDEDPTRSPGADEVCNDGKDDDCDNLADAADPDLDPGSLVVNYPDVDGDGFGTGTGTASCTADAGSAPRGGDCDDTRDTVFPGALETCNGRDDDCDRGIDEADAWWDARWPYRKLVEVTAPTGGAVPGLPIAVDVDLRADLAALGDASAPNLTSLRVVLQSCTLGQPPMPVELVDGLKGAIGGSLVADPLGNAAGTLVVLFDDDEDAGTADAPNPGSRFTLGVYYGSAATPAPGGAFPWPSSLSAAETAAGATIDSGVSRLELSSVRGGLASRLSTGAYASVATQTNTNIGNGIQFTDPGSGTASWVSVRDAAGTVSLVHDGPLVAVARSTGVASGASGGFAYTYEWVMIEGRPEARVRISYTLDRTAQIGPASPSWTAAVRPWFVNNAGLVALGASEGEADLASFLWARGAYDVSVSPFGLLAAWLRAPRALGRPLYDATGTANAGRYVGLVGQDAQASPGTTFSGRAGDRIVDGAWVLALPHAGGFGAVTAEASALRAGPIVTGASTTRRP